MEFQASRWVDWQRSPRISWRFFYLLFRQLLFAIARVSLLMLMLVDHSVTTVPSHFFECTGCWSIVHVSCDHLRWSRWLPSAVLHWPCRRRKAEAAVLRAGNIIVKFLACFFLFEVWNREMLAGQTHLVIHDLLLYISEVSFVVCPRGTVCHGKILRKEANEWATLRASRTNPRGTSQLRSIEDEASSPRLCDRSFTFTHSVGPRMMGDLQRLQ